MITERISILFSRHGLMWSLYCYIPKKAVQVSVPHVFKHHGQRLSVGTDAVEPHNVLVLEHRQQLRLPLEVLPGGLICVLQSL